MHILNKALPLLWSLYLLLLTFAILFKNTLANIPILWNLIKTSAKLEERNINITPFDNIKYFLSIWEFDYAKMNLLVNIFLFLPFGILIGIKSNKLKGISYVLLLSFMTSLSYELIQYYYGIGEFDVDDIILNVMGAIMGYVLVLIARLIKGKLKLRQD